MTSLIVAVVVLASPAPLSLPEVQTSCERAFPSILAAQSDVVSAEGERLSAVGAFDPSWKTRGWFVPISGYPHMRVDSSVEVPTPLWGANFFAGYRLGQGKIPDYYRERETLSLGELRAGVAVPLVRNGPIDRRRAALAKAELSTEVAQHVFAQQRLDILRAAAHRYWDWVAAGRRRAVAEELLRIALDRDGQLAARAHVGDVARFDKQDNERALAQRRALMTQAQRSLEQAALELSLYWRDDTGLPTLPLDSRLPNSFPTLESADAWPAADVERALSSRPDVQRLLKQAAQQEVETRLAQNQVLPGLDVGLAFAQDIGSTTRPELAPLSQPELEVSAVLDVPLLYRSTLGRLQAARAAQAKLRAQVQLMKDRVAVDIQDALSARKAAEERIAFTAQEVSVALVLEQGERTKMELGDSSLLFVNLREQATAEARLREIDAWADLHKAHASLRAALGAL